MTKNPLMSVHLFRDTTLLWYYVSQCRVAYEYERKRHSDHLDSLQSMEKNYVAMLREVEKLRNELVNAERRAGGVFFLSLSPLLSSPPCGPCLLLSGEWMQGASMGRTWGTKRSGLMQQVCLHRPRMHRFMQVIRSSSSSLSTSSSSSSSEFGMQGQAPPGVGSYGDAIIGSGGGGYEVGSRGAPAGYEAAARAAAMYSRNPGGTQSSTLSSGMMQPAARGGAAHQ